MKTLVKRSLIISLIIMIASFYNVAKAQVDTTKTVQPGTTVTAATDTTLAAVPDTTVQGKDKKDKKEDKKRKDEFIPYVGVNFNQLAVSSDQNYESTTGVGYHLGFDYKRGKFFYWQVGARFNYAVYGLKDLSIQPDTADYINVGVAGIDIPVTGGINFLSAINRIVALRLFVSAVPAIAIGVSENDLNLEKDDINSFMLYGQAGLGVNVAFLVIEGGYNFGLQNLLKDVDSKPGQIFINLGFRF
jgi:hypothetical protein